MHKQTKTKDTKNDIHTQKQNKHKSPSQLSKKRNKKDATRPHGQKKRKERTQMKDMANNEGKKNSPHSFQLTLHKTG